MSDKPNDDLLKELSSVVKSLSHNVDKLIQKIDLFMVLYQRSIPAWAVLLMFATLLGALFGKECIEWMFKSPLVPGITS